jgi:hypothetical protein
MHREKKDNDVNKVIASTIATAHLFFSLRHFRADDKSQIYYIMAGFKSLISEF